MHKNAKHFCCRHHCTKNQPLQVLAKKDVDSITKENLLKVLGVELGPVRIKCALLGYKVLRLCLMKVKEKGVVFS